MNILGLSGLAHDSAAALLGERGVEAASEESKLVRARSTAGIPRAAIRFCLERAGVRWQDVSYVGVASRPVRSWLRHAWFRLKTLPIAPIASVYYQTKAIGELGRELNNFRILGFMREDPSAQILALEHHLCHAASAFYGSAFDRAAILTLDENGDGLSGFLAVGEGSRIRVLRSMAFPHSVGWVYSQLTEVLGFKPKVEEHKTQWLSLEAEPIFREQFLELFRSSGSLLQLNGRFFRRGFAGRLGFSKRFYEQFDCPGPWAIPAALRPQLASSLQQACTEVVLDLARRLRRLTGARSLCLAGGVFLNGLLVAALEKESGFEEVFVQPAAGNEGTALGAAWLVWNQILGRPRQEPTHHVYWGPAYTNEEIKRVLDNCKCRYSLCQSEDEKLDGVIHLLEAGRIVGWYQGAAEFGPRALGNRSLLASPWAPYVKENLNEYVKHREPFRPFALAVPEEDCSRYFEWTPAARFMASMARARPEAQQLLEGFLLPGGRLRLHTVTQSSNPLLWKLLRRFGQRAQAPMLVNTSFNLFGEPLVVSPRDAVRSYFSSGIDALLIGSFLLSKT